MSLRRQLLLVSLLLLSLPWAGWQFLKDTERTLREGQQLAVAATAQAIATALGTQAALLYPAAARRFDARTPDWYLPAATQPLITDGYDDDWREQSNLTPLDGTPDGVTLHAASRGARLFILLTVVDSDPRYLNPSSRQINGDRLRLSCIDARGHRLRYLIATAAPGLVRARSEDETDTLFADRIRGTWAETSHGHRIELEMPLGNECQRLGLRFINAAGATEATAFDSRDLFGGELPWLVYPNPALERWLSDYGTPGRQLRVLDHRGQPIADISSDGEGVAGGDSEVFWLLRMLNRALLSEAPGQGADAPTWISSIAAIDSEGAQIEVRESTERYLALTDRTTARVMGIGALVLSVALMGLLAYASLLSWRIRRLRDAALAIAADPRRAADFPHSRASDELGELGRSYGELLRQIDDYNRYLRGLARTLSHELRTPIAIIGSSLEHLAEANLPAGTDAYIQRGSDGLQRLSQMLGTMSQVSRLEESLESISLEPLDLAAFLDDMAGAYTQAFTSHRIDLQVTDRPLMTLGAGEALAQALDKLVENAASFAPEGSTITLSLQKRNNDAELAVSNPGPPLCERLREQLFEPLVSVREGTAAETGHLGIGLHVARTIVERHGGSLRGENLPDGYGVCFTLRLPRVNQAPRRS